MTNRGRNSEHGILLRGVRLGAFWGAMLGVALVVVVFLADIVAGGSPGTLLLLPIYCPFAVWLGAVIGVVVATMVSVALILAGPNVRRDRARSRLLAGAVAAIPGGAVVGFALPRLTGMDGWLILAGIAIAAVVAAATLAPRVALGPADDPASRDVVRV